MFGKNAKNGGILNVIRCDEPDYLIWKWHPEGTIEGESLRENAIRWGSSLRVKDGSVAIFVYKQDENRYQEFIEGPFDDILKTKNLPIISSIIGLAYGGDSPFQAEIYFVNLAKIIQFKFAIPFFDVFDPRFEDYSVPVAIRGSLNYRIDDYRNFIKLHRLESFSTDTFNSQVKDAIIRYVKEIVINIPKNENISVIQLEQRISSMNYDISQVIADRFRNEFGVIISGIDISAVEIDKKSEGYIQLKSITQDVTSATIKAKTEAELLNISGMQRINLADYEETLRIQREENQYSRHLQSQSANLGAFQVEKQAEVGIAGANALGQMGANGAGSVEIGATNNGGFGFNPAAMMTSMAIGGAVGHNIAGTMNNIMSDMPKTEAQNTTPPPILYNVAVDGKPTGPYDVSTLCNMARSGEINGSTLVWRPGLDSWRPLDNFEELKSVASSIPPAL